MRPSTPAVCPMPTHSTAVPATVASAAKARPWPHVMRPEGKGRPAVRAISASRSRSCTWFMAEAPEDRSITPASTTSPCAHGKSAPSGARSMNPAAAETRTRSTMPNFESSAYALARSTSPAAPRARATALSALGTGHPLHARAHGGFRTRHLAPASRVHGKPDEGAPQRVGDDRVRGAHGDGEAGHHGRDAERHLKEAQAEEEQRGTGQRRASRRQGDVDEESQESDAEPAMQPVHRTLPVMWQHASAAEREIWAGEPCARMTDVAAEGELSQEDPEADHGEVAKLGWHRGMSALSFRQQHETAQDEERVHEMGRAHQIGQLEEDGDGPEGDLHREEAQEDQAQPSRGACPGPAPRQYHRDEEERGEGDRLEAMAELDEHLRLGGREEAPMTERPVGTAEPRAGGAHDVAHGHEEEERDDGRPRPAARRATDHEKLPLEPPRRRRRPPPASGRTPR